MKLLSAAVVFVLAGCAGDVVEDAPDLSEVASAITPTTGQGTFYQGTFYQGTFYQGTFYQGTFYQGTFYQGATYGSAALSDALTMTGSSGLVAWTRASKTTWAQRFPNRICYWNSTRTIRTSCTTIDLAVQPSPLAGIAIPATFNGPNGPFTAQVLIGSSASQVGAVVSDTTAAAHPLTGTTGTSTCALIPFNALDTTGARCDNPNGCRTNCDIWLYDLKLRDPNNGNALIPFCPSGEPATVVPGVYSSTGQKTSIASQFTFACTNGTIAKCTRWGYRPTGAAQKYCNHSTCLTDPSRYSMADYHQACVRAATADYCASGYSFTKPGTLVDIYDYDPSKASYGFVPKTRGGLVSYSQASAFVWESSFDKQGAAQIDHLRYQELEGSATFSTIEEQCPGLFSDASGDILCPSGSGSCKARNGGWSGPVVWIDSTPACSHSEHTVGKWLHKGCSSCTAKVAAYCTDPNDARGWDANCVAQAQSTLCTSSQRMASHGECTVGQGLDKLDSGCTLSVCLDPAYASCCNPASPTAWTETCKNAASNKCKAAKNGGNALLGFCPSILPPPGGTTTTTKAI
jgi:hypothetical protein